MAKFDCAIFQLLLLTFVTALNVKFQETDVVVKEESKILGVKVIIEHNTDSNVTLQIIPRTLHQFIASGQALPYGVNLSTEDPAEEGLDFDGSSHTIVVEPKDRQTKTVNISIFNDNITEKEEVFLLELRVVRVDPPEPVNSDRNVTVVRITPSAQDNTIVSLGTERTCFNESDGTISNALYLELNREVESNIEVPLVQLTNEGFPNMPNDLMLPKTFTVPPATLKIYIPFQIIDDNITEGDQGVKIHLKYRHHALFRVNTSSITITIEDNDAAIIGFSWNGSATRSIEIVEGETGVFCVALLEPQSLEKFVRLSLSSLPDLKDTSIISNQTSSIYILPQNLKICFSVRKQDNEMMNNGEVVRYQLHMDSEEEMILLDPSSLSINIEDDDGPPMKPTITSLSESDSNLNISWTAEVSKFKPVDKYIVSVMEIDPVSSIISRRQSRPFQEHETNKTSYTVPVSKDVSYHIQVCASNRNHRNCSREVTFSMNPVTINRNVSGREIFLDPVPLELVDEDSHRGLGRTSFIAVIVGPAVAVVLSIILILTVFFCRCWGERRQYYPSKQEKVMMANSIEMKNYYYRQRSSTTSITNEWSLVSPNNYLSQKETKPQLLTLGTPV